MKTKHLPTDKAAGRWQPDAHAIAVPAGTFTGDFYYTVRSDERFRFALGDVTGKGLRAAVIMAMIQETLEAGLGNAQSLADVVEEINDLLLPEMRGNRFASLIVGELDRHGSLRLVNAGHPPALLARRDGTVEILSSTGPVTGLLRGVHWCSFSRQLSAGESVVLYSDGVLEAQSTDGDEYGLGRIQQVVSAQARDATETARLLTTSVREHQGGGRFLDDMTVLVVRHGERSDALPRAVRRQAEDYGRVAST